MLFDVFPRHASANTTMHAQWHVLGNAVTKKKPKMIAAENKIDGEN